MLYIRLKISGVHTLSCSSYGFDLKRFALHVPAFDMPHELVHAISYTVKQEYMRRFAHA